MRFGQKKSGIRLFTREVDELGLALLEQADTPSDLAAPGHRLHPLKGCPDRWSVRVSGNLRFVFSFKGNAAWDVDLVDYH